MEAAEISPTKKLSASQPPVVRLSTVDQFVERYPAFTQGQLRWSLFNRTSNGLEASGAIVRFGRRLLLDEDKFFAWVLGQQRKHGD